MAGYTLITGATGGLGNAFCDECAKRGQRLILTGTSTQKLEALNEDLKNKYQDLTIEYKACDLSDDKSRKEFFDYLEEKKLSVNCLINNAGYIIEGEHLSLKDEDVIKAIRVNCEGTIDVTQKIIKRRNKEEELRIITVSSLAGEYPMPYMAIYSATKSMLIKFMTALNYELKDKNVYITTICPSGIPTTDAMKEAIKAQGFKGEATMSPPDEIARMAIKASDKHKIIVVPKMINRLVKATSRICTYKTITKMVGRMWKKSQDKRNFKTGEN